MIFRDSQILVHKITVGSNTKFYDLYHLIILELIPPSLFKTWNLKLIFDLFLRQLNFSVAKLLPCGGIVSKISKRYL